MEDKPKPKYRMGAAGIAIWMGLAGLADLATFIPFVGDLVGPIFFAIFSIYLWQVGCGFINGRRLATQIISAVAEMIPVVQEFPTIIIAVSIVIVLVRVEDKTGTKMIGKKGNLTAAGRNTTKLSAEGMREPIQNQQKRWEQSGLALK